MKKYFFILFVFTAISAFSQTDYSKISLEKDADYKPADNYALEASNYVLSVPLDDKNIQRLKSIQFVIKWMTGTPDYSFGIDESIMEKVLGGNEELLSMYMMAMTKYSLENPSNAADPDLVKLNAVKIILSYAEKSENKVAVSGKLKKLIATSKKGDAELKKAIE